MRVTAIQSFTDGHLKTFGDGEYIGDRIPDTAPFNKFKLKNPCIKLDSGKYVWGMQCWWGAIDKMKEQFGDSIKTTEVVDVEGNFLPVEETPES